MEEVESNDTSDSETGLEELNTAKPELVLGPTRGRSPAERELIAKTYPPVDDVGPAERRRFQFPIWSLMLLTLAVAIGLAGSTWVPAKVFAGVMALIANFVILRSEVTDVENPLFRHTTILLCVACGVAMCVALFG